MRELLDLRVGALGEAEPLEPARRCSARRARVEPVETTEVLELLADRHPRIEATLLRHVAEAHPLRQPDRLPLPEHLTGVELDESEDGTHRGRLARAVRTKEAEHPAARDRERAVGERLHRPEPLAHISELKPAADRRSVAGVCTLEAPGLRRDALVIKNRRHGNSFDV